MFYNDSCTENFALFLSVYSEARSTPEPTPLLSVPSSSACSICWRQTFNSTRRSRSAAMTWRCASPRLPVRYATPSNARSQQCRGRLHRRLEKATLSDRCASVVGGERVDPIGSRHLSVMPTLVMPARRMPRLWHRRRGLTQPDLIAFLKLMQEIGGYGIYVPRLRRHPLGFVNQNHSWLFSGAVAFGQASVFLHEWLQ